MKLPARQLLVGAGMGFPAVADALVALGRYPYHGWRVVGRAIVEDQDAHSTPPWARTLSTQPATAR